MGAIKEITSAANKSKLMKVGAQYTKKVSVKSNPALSRTSLEGAMYRQKHAIVNKTMARDASNFRKTKRML